MQQTLCFLLGERRKNDSLLDEPLAAREVHRGLGADSIPFCEQNGLVTEDGA